MLKKFFNDVLKGVIFVIKLILVLTIYLFFFLCGLCILAVVEIKERYENFTKSSKKKSGVVYHDYSLIKNKGDVTDLEMREIKETKDKTESNLEKEN